MVTDKSVNEEVVRLRSQVAALEQLLEVHEQTVLEQSDRLEQSLEALTRRAAELETVAQVSTVTLTILDTADLLQRVVDLTKERFGLYHAHIYLLDETPSLEGESQGGMLDLAAGAGEVGRQMVAEGWSIPLEREQSLVAQAARSRQGVIINDVRQDPAFLPNPLLSDTRSEMAVPIIMGDSVLGVLDVQADVVNRFTDEDVRIQTTLAAQVAVAMENARLFEEARIFRQFADASGQGLGMATLEGEITYANPTLARLFGEARPEDTLGQSIVSYYPVEVLQRVQDEILPAVMQAGQWVGEVPLISREGKLTPTIQTIFLIRDENGQPLSLANVLTDITDQKQAEAELEERLRELSALQRLMSREGWLAFQATQAEAVRGYLFDQTTLQPVTPEDFKAGDTLAEQLATPVSGDGQPVTKPVAVHDEIIGAIGVYDDPDQPLAPEDQEFLDTIAEQVAEAMERARLLEQAQKRAVEMGAVAQVSTIASTTLDVEKMLQTVVDLTKQRFSLYHAHVYLLDESEAGTLNLAAGAGEAGRQMMAEGWRIPLEQEQSFVAQAARTRQGVIANDVRQTPGFFANPLLPDTRSEMAVPMIAGDKVVGVLDVQADAVNRFTDEDVQIQTTLATQVAVALENARLFAEQRQAAAEIEEQAQRLAQLNEMSQQLNLATSEEEVFKVAARQTAQVIEADRVSVALVTPEGDGFETLALQGEAGAIPVGARMPLAGTAVEAVVRENRSMVFADIRNSDFAEHRHLVKQGLRSVVAAPLIVEGQVAGSLNIGSNRPNAYGVNDQNLAEQMAAILSSAIESRRLFAQTQAALALTENLYEAGRRISEAGDLPEVLTAVAETVSESAINRAVLVTFDRDSAGEVEAMTVAANWHSGQGTPPTPIGTRYPRTVFAAVGILLSPEPLFFDDVQRDERVDPATVAVLQQQNIRAMAILPLTVGTRQTGALLLEAEEVHPFTESEMQPYIALARQVAVAVENQRLFEETRQALAEVEATQRRYTVQAWETYRTREIATGYEQVREGVEPLGDELPLEVGQAIVRGQQLSAGDAQQDEAESSLVVPLTVRGEIIGVLGLQETDERQWTPEEVALVEAIGEQFAQAAENIRLLDETQQRAALEARINEIGAKIRATQSLEEALQIAVKEVGLSLKAPQTTVQLDVK